MCQIRVDRFGLGLNMKFMTGLLAVVLLLAGMGALMLTACGSKQGTDGSLSGTSGSGPRKAADQASAKEVEDWRTPAAI